MSDLEDAKNVQSFNGFTVSARDICTAYILMAKTKTSVL